MKKTIETLNTLTNDMLNTTRQKVAIFILPAIILAISISWKEFLTSFTTEIIDAFGVETDSELMANFITAMCMTFIGIGIAWYAKKPIHELQKK